MSEKRAGFQGERASGAQIEQSALHLTMGFQVVFAPSKSQPYFLGFRNLLFYLLSTGTREHGTSDSKCLFMTGMRGKKWDGGEDDNEANLYDQGPPHGGFWPLIGNFVGIKSKGKEELLRKVQ